jgi:hypothetical protein
MFKVPIYNNELPKNPRVFDVVVNDIGEIQRYEMQNIRGRVFVDETEVRRQIRDFLDKLEKAS